jgi:hypothetical protein
MYSAPSDSEMRVAIRTTELSLDKRLTPPAFLAGGVM